MTTTHEPATAPLAPPPRSVLPAPALRAHPRSAPAPVAAASFLGPGEGPALRMGSLPLVFKALPEWTGGAYEMHEHRIGAGVLVAPHTHARQDQANYVLAGTIGCLVGDQEFEVGVGGFIWRPRGVRHALWAAGAGEARFLEISSPGGDIAEFFRRFGELTEAGTATPTAIQALAAPYGITYDAAVIPYLEARHGVSAGGTWWPE
jgi:quercetin dioxygenase-like cupin family protein